MAVGRACGACAEVPDATKADLPFRRILIALQSQPLQNGVRAIGTADEKCTAQLAFPAELLSNVRLDARDRVAPGRCRPGAPTDPYVLALEHTVHQIRGSLRAVELNGRSSRAPASSAGACVGIGPRAFHVAGCGDEATCASIAQLPGGSLIRLPNSP
jgi:hypothetical protein